MKKLIFATLIVFIFTFGLVMNSFGADTPKYGGVLRQIAIAGPQVLSYVPMMGPGDHSAIFPGAERLLDTTTERQTGSGVEPVLAEKVVELNIAPSVSHMTIQRALKK